MPIRPKLHSSQHRRRLLWAVLLHLTAVNYTPPFLAKRVHKALQARMDPWAKVARRVKQVRQDLGTLRWEFGPEPFMAIISRMMSSFGIPLRRSVLRPSTVIILPMSTSHLLPLSLEAQVQLAQPVKQVRLERQDRRAPLSSKVPPAQSCGRMAPWLRAQRAFSLIWII